MRLLVLLLAGLILACAGTAFAAGAPGECAPGYAVRGDYCYLSLPQHAVSNANGTWSCERGTYETDGQCVPIEVPDHASLTEYGHAWVCDGGYRDTGGACVAGAAAEPAPAPCGLAPVNRNGSCGRVLLPRHARRVSNSFWVCQPGYQQIGDKCAPIRIPRFSHQSVSRDDWLCNRGYLRDGNLCAEIEVPDHATLGYYGDAWFCDRGYYELRSVCLEETDEHRALTARYGGPRERFFPAATVMPVPARPRSVAATGSDDHLAYIFAGAVAAVVAAFTLLSGRQPPIRPSRNLTMAYVPRRRGSGSALAIWRAFGHRVDALTGAAIESTATVAQCRNCHAWYEAASVGALRHENEARCVACGRAAVSYNIA